MKASVMGSVSFKDFARNSFFSYSSKMADLLIGFLYIFLIANYLGPKQFGLLSYLLDFFISATLLLGFTAVSESIIVFLPKLKSKILTQRLLSVGLGAGLIFSLLMFFFPDLFRLIADFTDPSLVSIMSFVIFFNLAFTLFVAVLTGAKLFGKIFKLVLLEHIIDLSFAAFFVISLGMGIQGAIFAKIISLVVTSFIGYFYYSKLSLSDEKPDWGQVRKFIKFGVSLGFAKRISTQSLLIFIGLFVDPIKLGLFYLVQKIGLYLVDMPVNAMNSVMLPTSAEHIDDPKTLGRLISLSIKLYVPLSILFSLLLLIAGPILVAFLFPDYLDAISIFPLFAIYFLMTFDVSLGTFYRAIKRNDVLFYSNLISLILTIPVGYLLIQSYSVHGMVTAMIVNRFATLAYQFVDLKRHNYPIEFIPTISDLKFFIEKLKSLLPAFK